MPCRGQNPEPWDRAQIEEQQARSRPPCACPGTLCVSSDYSQSPVGLAQAGRKPPALQAGLDMHPHPSGPFILDEEKFSQAGFRCSVFQPPSAASSLPPLEPWVGQGPGQCG